MYSGNDFRFCEQNSAFANLSDGVGWTAVTMQNGSTTPSDTNRLSVKKHGNIVYMMGRIVVTATTNGTVIATVPSGYRPRAHFRQLIPRYDMRYGNIGVATDGNVTMIMDTQTGEASKTYYLEMSWLIS